MVAAWNNNNGTTTTPVTMRKWNASRLNEKHESTLVGRHYVTCKKRSRSHISLSLTPRYYNSHFALVILFYRTQTHRVEKERKKEEKKAKQQQEAQRLAEQEAADDDDRIIDNVTLFFSPKYQLILLIPLYIMVNIVEIEKSL
jgi:hypothetical protein